MKTIWTKLLVALLAVAMVLSLAACGPKTPDESKPESTPAGSSPTESNPASSPESSDDTPASSDVPPASSDVPPASSDPVGSESDPAGKDESTVTPPASSEPADTDPVTPGVEHPEEPTVETYTTDGEAGNWVFEINKTDVAITVDGLLEEAAYYKGVYLIAEISMPDSDSTFSVFMTADETNIYVFYEFVKAEDIFWKADYGSKYHLDCVDFCLNLAGLKAIGKEFRIYAGVEGGMDAKDYVDGGAAGAGVSALYVKHTDIGYNVEFSIPLEKVTGIDDNGDKKISFTALSTITTAWDDPAGQPSRVYTAACCAAGALDKENPSYLVVKDTKVEGEEVYEKTEDGRYLITMTAAKESLVNADIKANAAVSFEAKFGDGPENLMNETNTYTVYLAADAENVYVFFEIKDSNIVSGADDTTVNKLTNGSQWWWNDCAEIDFTLNGNKPATNNDIPYQIRVWGETAGTDHYDLTAAENAGIKKGMDDGVLKSYTVTHTENGYNVLYVLDRAKFADDTFGMYFSVALGDIVKPATDTELAEYSRTYGAVDSVAKAAGNSAKPFLNVFKIVDAE